MRRVLLTCALVLVLGGATFVKADELREPSFPGAGAGEGDLMTLQAPGIGPLIAKASIATLLTVSLHR